MFGGAHKALRQRCPRPVQMWESSVDMCIGKPTRPLPPISLGGSQRISVGSGIPVVKLVGRDVLSRRKQHTVSAGSQRCVAKPHEPSNFNPLSGQHTRHRVGRAVGILQRLPQIEKAAALGHGGQAALYCVFMARRIGALAASWAAYSSG